MDGALEEAVLRLARRVRTAVVARDEAVAKLRDLYDDALHMRADAAFSYLRSVKETDDTYQAELEEALAECRGVAKAELARGEEG